MKKLVIFLVLIILTVIFCLAWGCNCSTENDDPDKKQEQGFGVDGIELPIIELN